jgi:hypothetical protein
MLYVEPDSPWKNGYREGFNSKLPGELLNGGNLLFDQTKRSGCSPSDGYSLKHGQATLVAGLQVIYVAISVSPHSKVGLNTEMTALQVRCSICSMQMMLLYSEFRTLETSYLRHESKLGYSL